MQTASRCAEKKNVFHFISSWVFLISVWCCRNFDGKIEQEKYLLVSEIAFTFYIKQINIWKSSWTTWQNNGIRSKSEDLISLCSWLCCYRNKKFFVKLLRYVRKSSRKAKSKAINKRCRKSFSEALKRFKKVFVKALWNILFEFIEIRENFVVRWIIL